MRRLATIAVLSVVAGAACGDGDGRRVTAARSDPASVVVRSPAGVASIDLGSGALRASAPGGVVSPDRTALVAAVPRAVAGGATARTDISVIDASTGASRHSFTVDGALAPRVTTAGADVIALAGGSLPPAGPYPAGRRRTELVVVAADGTDVRRYDLAGNVEPEAFANDGSALFVVDFSPPMAPDRYRVRRLDLATGEVGDVYSADKELQQDMRGTARTQVFAPDGSRLYTAYTLVDEATGHRRAFIHVLDLDGQWAHCVDLPPDFAGDGASLALSGDGRDLYVVRESGAGVAHVDTAALRVRRASETTLGSAGPVVDAAVGGGRLFVGGAGALTTVDLRTLRPTRTSSLPAPLVVMRVTDGRVHLVLGDRIVTLDAATAATETTVPTPSLTNVILGKTGGPLIDTGAGAIECAC